MSIKKIFFGLLLCAYSATTCFGQDAGTTRILTADSLAGGAYKDIFTSFLQLAFDNLTGPNKSLQFNSNPYAIMLKHNDSLASYHYYKKYTPLRKLNFGIGAKLDSSYRFNGLSMGLTYALVNNRDYTVQQQFLADALSDPKGSSIIKLHNVLEDAFSNIADPATRKKFRDDFNNLFNDSSKSFSQLDPDFQDWFKTVLNTAPAKTAHINPDMVNTAVKDKDPRAVAAVQKALQKGLQSIQDDATRNKFSADFNRLASESQLKVTSLDPSFQQWIMPIIEATSVGKTLIDAMRVDSSTVTDIYKLMADPKFSFFKYKNQGYNELKKLYQNRALWTVGISDTSYTNGYLFKNLQVTTEYLKGVTHAGGLASLQLDLKATLNFTDDSLMSGRNISRQVFTFEPGLNFTLSGKKTKQSWLEFKLSGSYSNVWKGLYNKETQVVNTINGTLRVMVLDNIWIPITIKYDPKSGNVLGFLNVSLNFSGLGNSNNSKKSS